jgi:hypothetical protein
MPCVRADGKEGRVQVKKVWKFSFTTTMHLPKGARIIHAAPQGDHVCLWAEVNPQQVALERRTFQIFGTGEEIPQDMGFAWEWVATWQAPPFVWHLYEFKA